MFKKIQTTIHSNGVTSRETSFERFQATAVPEDMARTLRNLRNSRGPMGRVLHTETSMTTLMVMYVDGTVVVFNYVAE